MSKIKIGGEKIPADAVQVSHADLNVRVMIDFRTRIDRAPLDKRTTDGVEVAVPELNTYLCGQIDDAAIQFAKLFRILGKRQMFLLA